MVYRIAFLFSAAFFVGCGADDGSNSGAVISVEPPESKYSLTIVVGDGSHSSASASIYDDSGSLLLTETIGNDGTLDVQLDLTPQVVNIEVSGGSVIDPVNHEIVDFGYNKLSTKITLTSDEMSISSPVNYLTKLAKTLPEPEAFVDFVGFDVFETEPTSYTKVPSTISNSAKARFLLDALYRFAYDNGISPLFLIGFLESDLLDGKLDGQGASGPLYLNAEYLTVDIYRYRLSLSAVRQSYAAGYLSTEFIAYADEIGSSDSEVLNGGTLFNVSSLSPEITKSNLANGSSLSDTVEFTFDVAEVVGIDSVEVLLNGQLLAKDQVRYSNIGDYKGQISFLLNTSLYPRGSNTINVTVSDGIGNSASEDYVYTFNSSDAAITTAYPNALYTRDAVEVGAYGSYAGAVCSISVDGVIRDSNTMYKTDSNCYSILDTRSINDGIHAFDVTVSAPNGTSDYISASFFSDNTSPEISLTSPSTGDYASGFIDIDAYVSDSIQLLSGSLYQGQTLLTSNLHEGPYSLDTTSFPDGETYFKILAEDSAGNTAQYLFLLNVENSTPEVGDGYPVPGTYAGNITVGAKGSYENSTCSITVDGSPRLASQIIKTDSDCYSVISASNLTDGLHTYAVIATTVGGASVRTEGEFTTDNTVPSVTNVLPVNNSYITGIFNISATIGDNQNLKTARLYQGNTLIAVDLQDSAFAIDSSNYADGETNFKIVAEDAAENETEAEIRLIFDNTLPEVEITDPWDGETITSSFTVRWQQSDTVGFCDDVDASTELIVGGLHYAGAYSHQEQYRININNRPEGWNEIKVIVTDCVGHQAEHSINVNFSPN